MEMNKNMPLGLPPGSVRAIIALMLILACIYYPVFGVKVPAFLKDFTGICIGYYFGSRRSAKTGG